LFFTGEKGDLGRGTGHQHATRDMHKRTWMSVAIKGRIGLGGAEGRY